jgi:hypothetical protein
MNDLWRTALVDEVVEMVRGELEDEMFGVDDLTAVLGDCYTRASNDPRFLVRKRKHNSIASFRNGAELGRSNSISGRNGLNIRSSNLNNDQHDNNAVLTMIQ